MQDSEETNVEKRREEKRSQFSESGAKKSKSTAILVVVVLVLAGVAAYVVMSGSSGTSSVTVGGQGGDVRIPLTEIGSQAKFYDYSLAGNKMIRFFVVKSTDGVYRAALDACDTCFRDKKGYSQQGDQMICNKCGLPFHVNNINEAKGGCNPVGLPRSIEDDHLIIKASELEHGQRFF